MKQVGAEEVVQAIPVRDWLSLLIAIFLFAFALCARGHQQCHKVQACESHFGGV